MSDSHPNPASTPRLLLKTITFSDGTTIELRPGERLILVGPNNVGKSAALSGIRAKVSDLKAANPVISSLQLGRVGTGEDVVNWASTWTKRNDHVADGPRYEAFGVAYPASQLSHQWENEGRSLSTLSRWFCHHVTGDERLIYSNEQEAIDIDIGQPAHPIHFLYQNEQLEKELSSEFRHAFGMDLVVNGHAGKVVRLHVGNRPEPQPNESTSSYVHRINELPTLRTQGDGMRSFAAVLLATSAARESIVLVDEPEAFLHPPQARILGQLLSRGDLGRQVVVATHSTDVLRGFLDTGNDKVQVLRLSRGGTVNHISILSSPQVRELWGDSLLRHSNVFDGLFHDRVVLCEGDADCRFFGAILGQIYDSRTGGAHLPDIMFTHCGGKDRIPMMVRALRAVGVPVRVVADFDVLRSEHPLRLIVEALGGNWDCIKDDWKPFEQAISSKNADKSANDIKTEILALFQDRDKMSRPLEVGLARQIKEILKASTSWGIAKKSGKGYIPNGQPTQRFDSLMESLRRLGLHVLHVGEVENFVPSVGGHGPSWVSEVLATKDLATEKELDEAKAFVQASCIDG